MTDKKLNAVAHSASVLSAQLEAATALLKREPTTPGPARDRARTELLALIEEAAKSTDAVLADVQALAASTLH